MKFRLLYIVFLFPLLSFFIVTGESSITSSNISTDIDTAQAHKKKFPSSWKSLEDIPRHWTMLEKDEEGYLAVDRCQGGIPGIAIDSNRVTINRPQNYPLVVSIDSFAIQAGGKAFMMKTSAKPYKVNIYTKIIDRKKKLVSWKLVIDWKVKMEEVTWVMTPTDFLNEFRLAKNPCPPRKE